MNKFMGLIIAILFLSGFSTQNNKGSAASSNQYNGSVPHLIAAASLNYPKEYIKKTLIIKLLKARDFTKLETILDKLQSDYESDLTGEMQVWHAFESFANSDPEFEKPLLDWHKSFPDSASPVLALGVYYENLGMHRRGGKLSYKVKYFAMKSMREYFVISQKYYFKAIQLNDQMMPAYLGFIRTLQRNSSKKDIRHFYELAAEISPSSYLLNRYYLSTLQPKWGGSRKEIYRHVKKIKKYFENNKKLASLGSYLDYSDADQTRDCNASLEIMNRAIKNGENAFFYNKRAYKHRCLKNFDEAWSDFTKAIQLQPETATYHENRGELLYKNKDYEESIDDFDITISLDALSWGALQGRGHAYLYQKRYEEAMLDLNNMLIFSDNKKAVTIAYTKIANVNLLILRNFEEAIFYFKKLIVINPKSQSHWAGITAAYLALNNCEAIQTSKTYFKLCDKYSLCDDFVEKTTKAMVKEMSEKKCHTF